MEQSKINLTGVLLIGRDAITVPCLAVVGAASIMFAAGYGAYKLGGKVCEMIIDKVEEMKEES